MSSDLGYGRESTGAAPGGIIPGWHPRELYLRARNSMKNPGLIGEASHEDRYRKVQWCMNLWRFLVVSRHPWLLVVQQTFYGFLFFFCWHYDIPLFFKESVNMDIILSAYFLGIAAIPCWPSSLAASSSLPAS